MRFDPGVSTFAGLPLHPLVIHAVVVLLPLATIGAVLVALRPAWRRSLGVPTVLVALVGVLAVPLATSSGWRLKAALGGDSPLVLEHAARAAFLLPMSVAFLLLLAGGLYADRTALSRGGFARTGRSLDNGPGTATAPTVTAPARVATVLTALAAVAGLVVTALVIWIGHSGATAVWQGVV